MSSVPPQLKALAQAALCLLLLARVAAPQAADRPKEPWATYKPVAEGFAYNSQEFRFRVVLPTDPTIQPENESTTAFYSAAKDEGYHLKVMVIALDKEAAEQDLQAYFTQFNKGMHDGGAAV